MKETYQAPVVEIIRLTEEDVITTSEVNCCYGIDATQSVT